MFDMEEAHHVNLHNPCQCSTLANVNHSTF